MKIMKYVMIVLSILVFSGFGGFGWLMHDQGLLGTVLGFHDRDYDKGMEVTYVYKNADGKDLHLDIYYPLVDVYDNAPMVVYYHGGAWVTGNKNSIAESNRKEVVEELRNNGYAVASVEYRTLSIGTNFSDSITDCQDALRYLVALSDDADLDSDNIGLWGASAGAHLALTTALMPQDILVGYEDLDHITYDVKYVVDYFGPVSLPGPLTTLINAQEEAAFQDMSTLNLDQFMANLVDNVTRYSPLTYVDKDDVNILVLHGEKDRVVAMDHSLALVEAFRANGMEDQIEMIPIEDGCHGFLLDPNMSQTSTDMVIEKTTEFIFENYSEGAKR